MDVKHFQGVAEDYSTSLDDLEGTNQIDLYGQSLRVTLGTCKTERNRKCSLKVKNFGFFNMQKATVNPPSGSCSISFISLGFILLYVLVSSSRWSWQHGENKKASHFVPFF